MNAKNDRDVPLGLGMALMQNPDAYAKFSMLSPARQQEIINQTHAIKSKHEMQSFVDRLAIDG